MCCGKPDSSPEAVLARFGRQFVCRDHGLAVFRVTEGGPAPSAPTRWYCRRHRSAVSADQVRRLDGGPVPRTEAEFHAMAGVP